MSFSETPIGMLAGAVFTLLLAGYTYIAPPAGVWKGFLWVLLAALWLFNLRPLRKALQQSDRRNRELERLRHLAGTLLAGSDMDGLVQEVAQAAGVNLKEVVSRRDRGEAVAAMSKGAPLIVAGFRADVGQTPTPPGTRTTDNAIHDRRG